MDVMELRRLVMAQMASGEDIVHGSFTAPNSVTKYTLNIGKTFSKYIVFIEMTDESKTALMQTGINGAKMFGFVGLHPDLEIGNASLPNHTWIQRVNPLTNAVSQSTESSFGYYDTYIEITASTTSSAHTLYYGYTYNYTIAKL